METYFIRSDYVANAANTSLDTPDRQFWTEERVRTSALYQWHVYNRAAQLVRSHGIRNVVDIGCGMATKLIAQLAPLCNVYGVDQPSAAALCRKRYGTETFYADDFEHPTLKLPVEFGLVVCSDVIEHVTDPDVLLSYIRRFCTQSTFVLLSTPDRERLRGKSCLHSPKAEHVREWSFTEFRRYLESRGFAIQRHWHLPPVKTAFNRLFLSHVARQLRSLRPYSYNQAALCRLAPGS